MLSWRLSTAAREKVNAIKEMSIAARQRVNAIKEI